MSRSGADAGPMGYADPQKGRKNDGSTVKTRRIAPGRYKSNPRDEPRLAKVKCDSYCNEKLSPVRKRLRAMTP